MNPSDAYLSLQAAFALPFLLCVAEVLQHAGRKCCSEPDTSFFFPAVYVHNGSQVTLSQLHLYIKLHWEIILYKLVSWLIPNWIHYILQFLS